MKPSDAPGFMKLLAEWNRVLKNEGFVDAEETVKNELRLKRPGQANRYRSADSAVILAKQEFYERVRHYVSITQFKNDFDRQILELFAEGLNQAEIKRKLNVQGHRCKIYYPLYHWLREWGLK